MLHGVGLRDSALLECVARTGNLSQAARSLEISPAVASRRLAAMEQAQGLRLAERTTRRTLVTAERRVLANSARRMLNEWNQSLSLLCPEEGAMSGTVRLSLPHMFGRSILASALTAFTRQWPGIRLSLRFSGTPLDLAAHDLDLAIRIARPLGTEGVVIRLAESRKVVVASQDDVARNGLLETPIDLCEHDCSIAEGRGKWTFERNGERTTMSVTGPH